jgi:hypothetical protein
VRPGRGQSQSDGLRRTERAATTAGIIAGRGPERRPRVDREGGHSGERCHRAGAGATAAAGGKQARRGADGEVGPTAAQEGLAVRLEP